MTGLVISILVALLVVFVLLTIYAGKGNDQPVPENLAEDSCGNCKHRYPMSAEDFQQFPCVSGHRCSLDGRIIEDMTDWCIHHKTDKKYEA